MQRAVDAAFDLPAIFVDEPVVGIAKNEPVVFVTTPAVVPLFYVVTM